MDLQALRQSYEVAYWGLRRAWDSGFRHVSLFCDVVSLVERLEHDVSDLHENADLFAEVGELLRHQWIVELRGLVGRIM